MAKAARRALCFVDPRGGAFASLAAAIARAQGRVEAIAATSSREVSVPAEIGAVLEEIGMKAPDVVLAAKIPRDAERVDIGSWELSLYSGEGDLERLSAARIARDRIERRIEAMASQL